MAIRRGARFTTAAALLAAACWGCAAPGAIVRQPPPSVAIRFPGEEPIRFGQLRSATITITNDSYAPILFCGIRFDGQLSCFDPGLVSFPGQLDARIGEREFVYDPDAPGATPAVFADNRLLFPGEALAMERIIRARFFIQGFVVLYRTIPFEDLAAKVCFPEEDPGRPGRVRYRARSFLLASPYQRAEPGTLGRTVVIPDPDFWSIEIERSAVRVPIADAATPGTIVERTGASAASEVTLWQGGGMWVVEDPRRGETFGVRTDGSRIALPRCDPRVFDVLDLHPDPAAPILVIGPDGEPIAEAPAPRGFESFLEGARARGEQVGVEWFLEADGSPIYGLALMGEPPAAAAEDGP